MDDLAKTLILGFPSFAGLLLCIYSQQRQIDRLMAFIERNCLQTATPNLAEKPQAAKLSNPAL